MFQNFKCWCYLWLIIHNHFQSSQSLSKVNITQDVQQGFRFSKQGTLIGSLGYYHLVFDINLTNLEDAIVALCSHTEISLSQMEGVFKEEGKPLLKQIKEEEGERCRLLVSDYLEVLQLLNANARGEKFHPGHVPFSHINNTVQQYLPEEVYKVQQSFIVQENVASNAPGRLERQVIIGLLLVAGIVAIGTALWFSHSELLKVSVDADRDANLYAVQKLQDTEIRSKVNQKALDRIIVNLKTINKQIMKLELAAVLTKMTLTNNKLETSIRELMDNLIVSASLQLAPKFIKAMGMKKKITEISQKLQPKSYQLAIRHIRDLIHSPISFLLFKTGKLRIIIHLPMYRHGTLLDLWKFHNIPLTTLNKPFHEDSKVMMRPKIERSMLAVDSTHSMVRIFDENLLTTCKQIDLLFYCENTNIYTLTFKNNCLYSLFTQEVNLIKQNCQFEMIPYQPFIVQLNSTTFPYESRR